MRIEILGSGCAKCKTTEERVRRALADLNLEAEVVKVEDLDSIMDYGVMLTPAVVVDGEVQISGRVPTEAALKKMLQD